MSFYKVVVDGMIVGACTEEDFRRYQAKHRIIVIATPDRVEAVDCAGTLYHDTWMAEAGFPCEPASVVEITEEEYESLKEQLDAGDMPDDGSLDVVEPAEEEPAEGGGEEVRKTAAQLLQEAINSVDSQVKLAARFASV